MTNEELYRRYQEGDPAAAEKLFLQLEMFIRRIAVSCAADFCCLRYSEPHGIYTAYTEELLKELCAEGALMLLEQLQSGGYDETKGKLTTWLYPHIKYTMYRWLEQDTHTLHIEDFATNEEGENIDPLDVLPIPASMAADRVVYRKVRMELLKELFDTLGERDKYILGHSYGAFGYKKLSLDELSLREMLKADGVIKARKAALGRLREKYRTSRLRVWHWAHHAFPRR